MTEDEMSEPDQRSPGSRESSENRPSRPERDDGPFPFLEELFRGDGEAPEGVRRRG